MAASSVSRAIANLESELKARLFQRTTRNLTPTQAGEQFYQRVEALIEELDIAQQEILNQHQKPSGLLRISTSVSFGQIVVAPLLKTFHEKYPDIRLELTLSDARINIISDQFDLAIRHGKLSDSSFVARKLMDVKYRLVASLEYLRSASAISNPEDIKNHPLITFTYPEFSKEWNFRRNGIVEAIPIKPKFTFSTALTIKECLRNGMGLGLLPDWAMNDERCNGRLIQLLPDWEVTGSNYDTAIWLIYPSRTFMPVKTRAFADFLLSEASHLHQQQ